MGGGGEKTLTERQKKAILMKICTRYVTLARFSTSVKAGRDRGRAWFFSEIIQ